MSSEADSLMSKIRQMEADRRKSNERIRQLEAALQSHAHLAATSLNVVPVTRPIYPSPSSVQPSSVAVGQPMMSPVVGSLTPESYSSVMSGGPPPPPTTAGYGRGRKARDRRRPVGCPACQLLDDTVAPSCLACRPPGCHNFGALDHWKRDCPVSRQGATAVVYSVWSRLHRPRTTIDRQPGRRWSLPKGRWMAGLDGRYAVQHDTEDC